MKIGRNEPCICGSGIKYKKCCLPNELLYGKKNFKQYPKGQAQETLIMTTTQEPYMPIRLYYTIFDKDGLLNRLNQLQCVMWSIKNQSFFINYEKEAKKIGLSVKYNAVPKELFPVILAEGNIENDECLHLDLRSFERAVCLVEFLDRYISRRIIKITHVATYNEFQSADINNFEKIWNIDYDELFADENMVIIDPELEWEKIQNLIAKGKNPEEKLALVCENSKKQRMSLVEKFPIYYYEEGIERLDGCLKFRMALAFEHWEGNENYTPFDLAQKIAEKF